MGESNLERNTLAVFTACLRSGAGKKECADIAKKYADEKAKVVAEYFRTLCHFAADRGLEWQAKENCPRVEGVEDARRRITEILDRLSIS